MKSKNTMNEKAPLYTRLINLRDNAEKVSEKIIELRIQRLGGKRRTRKRRTHKRK